MPPDGTDQQQLETAKRRVAGRYTLLAPAGRGGMGAVWRALDEVLQREVAVKEVGLLASLPEGERESVRARVMREAQAAARMSHPASVVVFDVIEEGGSIFIVMEFVEAPTLTDLVAGHGPLTPWRAAEVGLQLLDVLEAAHAQGVVHRDVKPSNIMVLPSGAVKLGDFGIASVKDHPSITRTGQVLGSPSYMAPERARGQPSDPASDLWGLGATLYYALEGRPPFEGSDALTTLVAVVNGDPRPAERSGPMAPLVARLLAKEPAERPTGPRLRAELEAVARQPEPDGEPGAAPSAPARSAPVGSSPDVTRPETADPRPAPAVASPTVPNAETTGPGRPSAIEAAPERAPSGRRGPVVVVAATLALAALVLVLIMRGQPESATEGQGDGVATEERGSASESAPPTTERRAAAGSEPRAGSPAASRTTGKVPDDWVRYTDTATGYRISHPPGWEIHRLDRSRTDFRDPATGAYLRVDWTDTPGESPVAAWEQQSRNFGARHENYRELGIEPTTYKGFDAALWEYTYTAGVQLHAVNLGFVTGRYGFALNFQTPERNWEESQSLFEAYKEAFEVPA